MNAIVHHIPPVDAPAMAAAGDRELHPYRYRAFGLSIGSEIPLQGLTEWRGGEPDLHIVLSDLGLVLPDENAPPVFEFTPHRQTMIWGAVGAFQIAGDRIHVQPRDGVGPFILGLPLLGPVLGMVLHLRGLLVIHAGAIALGPDGVIVMADKGTGKSTTSASLLSRGHRLLSDDVVAVEVDRQEGPWIRAAAPTVKVHDRVAARFGWDLDAGSRLPHAGSSADKRQYDMSGQFAPAGAAISRIYVLARGDSAGVEALGKREAFEALVRFSYVTRFGSDLLAGLGMARHLANCARLSATIPVARLTVADDLARVDAIETLVLGDLGRPCSP